MQRRVFVSPTKNTSSRRVQLRTAKDLSYNYDEFKVDVSFLRANANMKITDVASNSAVFHSLQKVRVLLQTMSGEKTYDDLAKIIDEKFSDVVVPIPYTIGAQFRGWKVKTNMDGSEFEPCVAVRIGSLQRPGYVNKCKYISMYADWSNDKFVFINDILDRSTDKRPTNQVVINVPFINVNTFPGFSTEEKEILRNDDITEVCIVGFKLGSNDYVHLTKGEFITIDNVKTRYTTKVGATEVKPLPVFRSDGIAMSQHKNHDDDNDQFGAAAWIFFILIIIVIIMLFWFFWK